MAKFGPVAYTIRQETLDRFADKVGRVRDRSVEPKNGGPTAYSFALAVGAMGGSSALHGTVIKRLRVDKV